MYKNIDEFIRAYYKKNPEGHYFDQETLKFFGERLSDMRLLKKTAKVKDIRGVEHEAYVISRLQRKHPGGPQRTYAYFDVDALTPIITE
jgi:hypothetical protein